MKNKNIYREGKVCSADVYSSKFQMNDDLLPESLFLLGEFHNYIALNLVFRGPTLILIIELVFVK